MSVFLASSRLIRGALLVLGQVGTAVSMLRKLDELVPILADLGTRHVSYGVQAAHCESAAPLVMHHDPSLVAHSSNSMIVLAST